MFNLWFSFFLFFCSTKLFANLVSLCINKCVESVELRLKHFPHSLHSNSFSALWIALKHFKIYFIHHTCLCVCNIITHLCWVKLISWPKVLLQSSQANGLQMFSLQVDNKYSTNNNHLLPLWLLLTWTSVIQRIKI